MRVIINRTDALGDTLLTLPLAQAIKQKHPDSHITFLVRPKCRELLGHNPFVDEVWAMPQKRCWPFLWRHLSKNRPHYYFHVGGSFRPTLMACLLRVPHRGGLKSRWPSFLLLNCGVRQRRSQALKHETAYNLDLLSPIGIDAENFLTKVSSRLYLDLKEKKMYWSQFGQGLQDGGLQLKGEFLVIHPGMTGHTLNWPLKSYVELLHLIETNYPERFSFVVSYTSMDAHIIDEFRAILEQKRYSESKKSVIFYNGDGPSLRHYMAILARAKLFIGPSTGPTHMANALGVNVIALYSPLKVQSATRWGPFLQEGNRVEVLSPPDQSDGDRVMELISVEAVMEKIKAHL